MSDKKKKLSRIELEKSNQFLQMIQDSAGYALISGDVNGLIKSFNKKAEEMLEYKASELIDKQTPAIFHDLDEVVKRSQEFSELLGEKIEPGFDTFICHSRLGLVNEFEWTYISKSGRRFPVLLNITALRDEAGELVGFLGVAKDITHRKKQESDLLKAKVEAEKALMIKSEFLANMSHEIRTPMNGIIGLTNLLLDSITKEDNREKLLNIKKSADSLLAIINDILDISKIEAEKIELSENTFNLDHLLASLVGLHRPSLKSRGVDLSYEIASEVKPFILADEHRLRQVIGNLLSNAIKFTDKGSIKVDCSLSGKNLLVRVIDTGKGIDKSENIFTAFMQEDNSTTRRYGGTGLGLTICKNVCLLMGGDIIVKKNEPCGSIFEFWLPYKESVMEHISQDDNLLSHTKKSSSMINSQTLPLDILVVEDVKINQIVIKGFLGKLGYIPSICENGQEAVEFLLKNKVDIVFMDCHMPVLDGYEASRQIREKLNKESPYIIALSASVMSEEVERCYACGMDDFLGKPLVFENLLRALHDYKKRIEG